MYTGDYKQSWALQEETLALYESIGSRWNVAITIGFMGTLALYQADFQQAISLLSKSIAQLRELGEHWYVALELGSLCHAVRRQGDLEQAEAIANESIAIFREMGDKRAMDIAPPVPCRCGALPWRARKGAMPVPRSVGVAVEDGRPPLYRT
ncbi:MAG TPA: tetratricopeptide repeat protein [Chloroflexia bacterium]|jgi:hypothetical protein